MARACDFFGFDWLFRLEAETESRSVQLPHDWSVDYPVDEQNPTAGSGGYARAGVGVYEKTFTLDAVEGRLSLLFEGVYMNCVIWVNDLEAARHVYGYTSFFVDITGIAHAGDNTIRVRVDNSMQPNSRWYSGSGITRNVWLVRTGDVHVGNWGTYIVTPEADETRAAVQLQTRVENHAPEALTACVESRILGPDGAQCACVKTDIRIPAHGGLTCLQDAAVDAPVLWSPDAPNLYTLRTRILGAESVLDEYATTFGIRSLCFDRDQGFFLNGVPTKMRGVCVHHDGGCVGAAVPPEIWRRRMGILKAMGCNAIRCSHNPPDPAFLDLCDELGFLVMDEAFDEWRALKGKAFGSNTHESRGYSEWFDECHRADIESMLYRDRNHPSIVIWSIGNEVPEQKEPLGHLIARELRGICHAIDPTRPVTQANDQIRAEPAPATEAFLGELDIVGLNYVDRWRARTETYYFEDKYEHPERLFIGTEHGAVGGKRGEYPLKSESWYRGAYHSRSLKAEKLWKYTASHDFVMGDFMWTGIDHLGECFWPDKGSSSGVIDTCGFPKDGYYFYQSQWTKEPMIHLLPHWNMDVPEGTVLPVLAYTNCQQVELFVNGVSYGRKAYEFPLQGMTQTYAHFDRPQVPITTNDLHLAWDVPYQPGKLEAVGYIEDREVARAVLPTAGKPARLCVRATRAEMPADGRSVFEMEAALLDEDGNIVPNADMPVTFQVRGGAKLLGTDNGRPDSHALYSQPTRETFHGYAYAVVRAGRTPGECAVEVSAPGLESVTVDVTLV